MGSIADSQHLDGFCQSLEHFVRAEIEITICVNWSVSGFIHMAGFLHLTDLSSEPWSDFAHCIYHLFTEIIKITCTSLLYFVLGGKITR